MKKLPFEQKSFQKYLFLDFLGTKVPKITEKLREAMYRVSGKSTFNASVLTFLFKYTFNNTPLSPTIGILQVLWRSFHFDLPLCFYIIQAIDIFAPYAYVVVKLCEEDCEKYLYTSSWPAGKISLTAFSRVKESSELGIFAIQLPLCPSF